jgi:cell division protease FtsH
MVNEAALIAARDSKDSIEQEDFEQAKDKVMMGTERRSLIISDEEKKTTAYHEAGHALVAKLTPGTDPVHKVTIIPRGRALGLTQQLPVDDRHTYPKEYLLGNLAVLMGGRVAEEIALDTLTTGAGNDIERASQLARKMVCEWGMSETMGPMSFAKQDEQIFLGREISQHRDYSEETAQAIDHEVSRLVNDAYEKAQKILKENREVLENMAQALLDRETLDGKDVEALINGEPLPPNSQKSHAQTKARSYSETKEALQEEEPRAEDKEAKNSEDNDANNTPEA